MNNVKVNVFGHTPMDKVCGDLEQKTEKESSSFREKVFGLNLRFRLVWVKEKVIIFYSVHIYLDSLKGRQGKRNC